MRAHDPIGVLPHLGHRIDVARLECLIERRIRGPHIVLSIDSGTVSL